MEDRFQAFDATLRDMRQTLDTLKLEQQQHGVSRTQLQVLEEKFTRLLRIVDGDDSIGFKGLRAQVVDVENDYKNECSLLNKRLMVIETDRTADANQIKGMGTMLRLVSYAMGGGFIAQLYQIWSAINP